VGPHGSESTIDIFSRKEYRDIIVDSLNYCIQEKGLVVYGWVIMSNHIHLIITTKTEKGNISSLSSGILRNLLPKEFQKQREKYRRADGNGY
jgi:REP element-mobilizing transposase RayT